MRNTIHTAKFKSYFLLGFWLLTIHAVAQNGNIEGVITDKNTKETLVGANVIISGANIGSIADLEVASVYPI